MKTKPYSLEIEKNKVHIVFRYLDFVLDTPSDQY